MARIEEQVVEVVIAGPDPDWLAEFTRGLVGDGLAACGHLIPAIRAIYRWDGVLHDEPEARVALHTRRSLVPAIVARAEREHPYDVPCVLALDVLDGNPAYLDWVRTETAAKP